MDALKKSVKQGKGAPEKAPAKSGKSQGKRSAASRSGAAKKQSRTAPKRKSA
jgi:hypothetical protein